MKLTAETVQAIEKVTESALVKIGAADIPGKVKLAVKFAWAQPPREILLNGERVTAVAVDIATVFTPEGCFHQIMDAAGAVTTAESVRALSVVLLGDDVMLCKSAYDAVGTDVFLNARYWTTSLDALTEEYLC